mmetsp:Transcript_11516/g.26785  ORF Transcript_11516/g.26785 Transcript_11516/m.26785 type:complete len:288 (+) Transcript_11516:218-1081(+)
MRPRMRLKLMAARWRVHRSWGCSCQRQATPSCTAEKMPVRSSPDLQQTIGRTRRLVNRSARTEMDVAREKRRRSLPPDDFSSAATSPLSVENSADIRTGRRRSAMVDRSNPPSSMSQSAALLLPNRSPPPRLPRTHWMIATRTTLVRASRVRSAPAMRVCSSTTSHVSNTSGRSAPTISGTSCTTTFQGFSSLRSAIDSPHARGSVGYAARTVRSAEVLRQSVARSCRRSATPGPVPDVGRTERRRCCQVLTRSCTTHSRRANTAAPLQRRSWSPKPKNTWSELAGR